MPGRLIASSLLLCCAALAATGCSSASSPADPTTPPTSPSPASPSPSQSFTVPSADAPQAREITFTINGKPVVVSTDGKAPTTVASMTQLAEAGYFDGTPCHRLVTQGIFVLQCGDPTGTGMGDPGYQLPDENLPKAGTKNYPTGTVAMANAGPGTGGSQFFIVYKDTSLPPDYTIWGKVSSGLDTVEAIAAKGAQGGLTDGPPAESVTIDAARAS